MDIQLAFNAPQKVNDTEISELPLNADRLTIDNSTLTLRAFFKEQLVAETPITTLTHVDLPGRRSVEKIRATTPNAFRPWTKEADDELLALRRNGADTQTLCAHFGRGRNSILLRLDKLGALSP